MAHPRRHAGPREACEIVDFDELLLDRCPPQLRADLLAEAELLVSVFAPAREPAALERIAAQLSTGQRDAEMNRVHARRLAAALKRIAETVRKTRHRR